MAKKAVEIPDGHVEIVVAGDVVVIPQGDRTLQIRHRDRNYFHKTEDDHGRWVYEAD